ncbi:MAG: succinylglutamate desuccinylase/aspartoacylase family protein [Candidatus Geothermarchaeales archaeon]
MNRRGLPARVNDLLVTYDEFIDELKGSSDYAVGFYPSKPRDIPIVKIGDSEDCLMIVARIHGDEPTGTEACRRFIKSVKDHDFSFVIFPIVNTYGCEYNVRENINHNNFSENLLDSEDYEALALRDAVKKFTPSLILDLHNTNFLTKLSKSPKGYINPANDERSIDTALYIKDYLESLGLSDLIREDMLPEYFLKPSRCKYYRKVTEGVFVGDER